MHFPEAVWSGTELKAAQALPANAPGRNEILRLAELHEHQYQRARRLWNREQDDNYRLSTEESPES